MILPPMENPSPHQRRRRCHWLSAMGFTLVEVVLALGIASFVLVSILGLLALGLDRSGDNRARMAEAQILEWMKSQARKAHEGGSLELISESNPYLFDNEGARLALNSIEDPSFSALAEPGEKSLPGSSQKVLGVQVTITKRGGQTLGHYAFWFAK